MSPRKQRVESDPLSADAPKAVNIHPQSLPASVFTLLGPMPVERVAVVDEQGNRGECDLSQRRIKVQDGLAPVVQWQTLGHELAHAIIGDAGLDTVLTPKQTELVCDAVGTWLAAAVMAGAVVVR